MSRKHLVLLHGWGMHGGIWGTFAQSLQQDHVVHCLDLPGYGGSVPLPAGTLEELAQAVLPMLPAEKCTVLGWSLGGMVALRLAHLAPDRVEKLILLASSPRFCQAADWPAAMAPAVLDAFEAQMRGEVAATLARFLAIQAMGGEDARAQVAQLRRRLTERALPSEQTLRAGLAVLRHDDLRSLLPDIQQPVCLIHGTEDTVVPAAAAKACVALLPQARLHLLAECAHTPFVTRPEEVAGIVRTFIAEDQSAPAAREPRPNPVRRAFEQAAESYDQAADIQRRVAEQLAQYLDRVLPDAALPAHVLDLGAGTGYGQKLLTARCPEAQCLELDLAHTMLLVARRNRGEEQGLAVCADLAQIPIRAQWADLVWSSLTLQWANDLEQALSQIHRCMAPQGLLHFSTLVPGSLRELDQAFAAADNYRHVNRFQDEKQVRHALAAASFELLHMTQLPLVAEYPDLAGVLRALRAIGARRVTQEGLPGLMGKARWRAVTAAYEAQRRDGMLPATYEVLYVTARKLEPAT